MCGTSRGSVLPRMSNNKRPHGCSFLIYYIPTGKDKVTHAAVFFYIYFYLERLQYRSHMLRKMTKMLVVCATALTWIHWNVVRAAIYFRVCNFSPYEAAPWTDCIFSLLVEFIAKTGGRGYSTMFTIYLYIYWYFTSVWLALTEAKRQLYVCETRVNVQTPVPAPMMYHGTLI